MGIGLDAFRTAVSGSKPWLEVSGKSADKSAIAAKKTSTTLDLSDLTKLDANSLNRAADNVYLRGQLLTGIRASMINAGLMQGGGAVGQGTSYAEKFLAKAEQALFGQLDNKGHYELNAAGQDLSTATVKDLLAELDQLVPQGKGKSKPLTQLKGAMAKELGKSTTVSEKQCKALLGLTEKKLASCLKVKTKALKGMSLEKLESHGDGALVVCTFKDGKGALHEIAARNDGTLCYGDDLGAALQKLQKNNDQPEVVGGGIKNIVNEEGNKPEVVGGGIKNIVNEEGNKPEVIGGGIKNIVNEESNIPEHVGGNDNKINEKLDMPEKPQESNLDKSVNSLGEKEPLEEINTSIKTKDSQPKPPVKGADEPKEQQPLPPDKMLATNCPHATKAQKDAVLGLNPQKIAKCLGLKENEAQELRMTGLKTVANGKYVLCTMISSKEVETCPNPYKQATYGKKILVDGDGNLLNYEKTDYGKCCTFLAGQAWMVDSFKSQDLPDINYIMDFVKELNVNMIGMVVTMLPGALEKAHQLQPEGMITLETWWNALGLAEFGMPPVDDPDDLGTQELFENAITARLTKDYKEMTGRDVDPEDNESYRPFTEFMRSGSDGLPYSTRLFCMKYGIMPSLGDYPDGCVLHNVHWENGLTWFDANVPPGFTELISTRMKGMKFSIVGEKEKPVVVGVTTTKQADALKIYSSLKESGFTSQQLETLCYIPNNVGMTLPVNAGYPQSTFNIDVSIQRGKNGQMIAHITIPCVKIDRELNLIEPTGNTLSYDVTIFPDGSMRSDSLKLNTSGTGNNALKTIGDGSFRLTAAQSESLLHPDRMALSKLLGIKEKQAAQVKFGDFEPAMGVYVRFTATLPNGKTVKLQANRNGGLMLDADVNPLCDALIASGSVPTVEHALVLVDAFRPEDMKLATDFLRLANQGADYYTNLHGSLGAFTHQVKTAITNLLISTLPTLPRKSGQTMKDLLPTLWKKLGLAGKAPKVNNKNVGVNSAGYKFASAVRQLIREIHFSTYGTHLDDFMKRVLDPVSEIRELEDLQVIQKNEPLAKNRKVLSQSAQYLMQPDGLSIENRIKLQKGEITPTMKDFMTVGIMAQSMTVQDPARILLAAVTELGGGGVKRYDGAKYHYKGKVVLTLGADNAMKDAQNTVGQLSDDGFTPKQIYQLAYYLNNSGTSLMTSSGLYPYAYDSDIEILPQQSNGDMRVRARLPVVRYKGVETVDGGKTAKAVGLLSNEYIEHEFTIRADGTMDVANIRFLRDPNMPLVTEVDMKVPRV